MLENWTTSVLIATSDDLQQEISHRLSNSILESIP